MTGRAPSFWFTRPPSPLARVLAPLGRLYSAATAWRLRQRPVPAGLAVICCGNASAGGTGKTPTALHLLALLQDEGWRPCALTRGHGGRLPGPDWVTGGHDAAAVGDEALLLHQQAPTIVARDRLAGARLAAGAGYDVAVMDDGLQHPQPARALNILVVDGARGFGNGLCIPAGPLREPVARIARRCRLALVIGPDTAGAAGDLPAGGPQVVAARLKITGTVPSGPLLAFAGIGRPEKFFEALEEAGNRPIATGAFPDHYRYDASDLEKLSRAADSLGARLVTTAKDAQRLPASWAGRVSVAPAALTLAPDGAQALRAAVREALGGARALSHDKGNAP